MYKVMRQTPKSCFAFEISAAGRIPYGIEQALRTAFETIRPIDGIYVGMFPAFRTRSGKTPQSFSVFRPVIDFPQTKG
jgi:hypothetical protein